MTVALAEVELYGALSGSWTDQSADPANCTVLNGRLWLDSDGTVEAVAEQIVTINQQSTLHVLKFEVVHGPINVRIGDVAGDDELMNYQKLATGIHMLEFTPVSANVGIQFWHKDNAGRAIDSIEILTGPDFVLPVPFSEDDLRKIHHQQISDVLYLAAEGYEPRRIERRGHRSWSITKFRPNDGPFADVNTSDTSLKASATSGEVTITASDDVFSISDVGQLIEISGAGQYVTKVATAGDTYSSGIKVTGLNSTERTFSFSITGSFTASVRVQRSSGNENNYVDYLGPYTSATTATHYDAQDNQTWYYRLAVKSGEFTSGSVNMSLQFAGGSTTGIGRIVGYLSASSVRAECLSNMPGTNPLRSWKRGAWNNTDGWPVSVTHGFARMWFGRGTRVWASGSDNFTSFAGGTEADKAISGRLGVGSPEAIRWLGFTQHLVIGTKTREFLGLGNTNNEAVGPTNFQTIPSQNEGGSNIMPAVVPGSILFIHRTKRKVVQFTSDPKSVSETAYVAVDLNRLSSDLVKSNIVRVAVQHEPERRVFVVLESGVCHVLLFRREEEVVAWTTVKTDGHIEDVSVVPQNDEDSVTFIVRRHVQGIEKRFIEELGPEAPDNDEEHFHLDSTIGYELSRPDATLTLSAYSGTVTLTSNEDAFTAGDVGKILWANIGDATVQLTITVYNGARAATASVNWVLGEDVLEDIVDAGDDLDSDSGRWGMNTAVSSFSGLDHLEGESVRVFGDMLDLGDYTVSSGAITLSRSVSVAYAGKKFRSRWKSLKLAYGAQKGTALTMQKAVRSIGLLLYRCGSTLTFGNAFSRLRPVSTRDSAVPLGAPVPLFTGEKFEAFDAQHRKDPRIYLEVDGPHPATVAGYIPGISEHDR